MSAGPLAGALLALLLLSCTTSDNSAVITELEQRAEANRDAELERRVRGPQPYRPTDTAKRAVLKMTSAKVPVVEGAINGVAMPLLLDTGTTHVVVSGAAARACELYLPPGHAVSLLTPLEKSASIFSTRAILSLAAWISALPAGIWSP